MNPHSYLSKTKIYSSYLIYFFFDVNQNLLYIGKTTNLKKRISQHLSEKLRVSEKWRNEIDLKNIKVYSCKTLTDLEVYETYFINKYKPLYNLDKVFGDTLSFEPPLLEPTIYSFELKKVKGVRFDDYLKEYLILKKADPTNNSDQFLKIETKYPLIKEAYQMLGENKIKALGCDSYKIKKELENLNSKELIESEIKKTFEKGFYLPKDVKVIVQSIYDNLGIVKTAKAKDIEPILNTKISSKKINDKVVNGYFVK